MNARSRFVLLVLFAAPALAADPPKVEPKAEDDPIAAQLLKDKEAFIATQDKACEDVLKAFDKYYESVKGNKTTKIELLLAQLEKIETEKKAFEESGVPPTLVGMKVAMSEYRTTLKKAEVACKAAFDKAIKAYRDKGDLKAAGTTLEEMKEFLAKVPGSGAGAAVGSAVTIQCGHTNKVLMPSEGSTDEGAKVVIGDYSKGDQTQLWKVVPAGDGFAYIENVKSGLVMTAKGKANASEVTLAKKHAPVSDSQLWKLTPVANIKDAQKVFGKASGKLWAVNARGTEPGTQVIIWPDAAPKVEHAHMFGFIPPK